VTFGILSASAPFLVTGNQWVDHCPLSFRVGPGRPPIWAGPIPYPFLASPPLQSPSYPQTG